MRDLQARSLFALCLGLALALVAGCSSDPEPFCPEGELEVGGPHCCPGGCGEPGILLPRICRNAKWVCQKGVVMTACAYPDKYGSPGFLYTYFISHDNTVYKKDLGRPGGIQVFPANLESDWAKLD